MDKLSLKIIVLGIIYIIAVLLSIFDFIKRYIKTEDSTEKYKYIFQILIRIISSTVFLILFNVSSTNFNCL